MKHKFLLDENILYEAVKLIDLHGNPDPTSAELVRFIRENCHRLALDRELAGRYIDHLSRLQEDPARKMEPLDFVKEFIMNSSKRAWESTKGVTIPPDAKIPPEDLHIARLALVSKALVVTSEKKLREAINHYPPLRSTALTPHEALRLAREK